MEETSVLITGGTGFVGQALVERLLEDPKRYAISVHSRSERKVRAIWGDAVRPVTSLQAELSPKIVINLTGENVFGRWTAAKKARIQSSRVQTTEAVVSMIERAAARPKVLVNASAVGYYGFGEDELIGEDAPPGDDFLANVCKAWERAARRVEPLGVRLCILRVGLVLGLGGGPLPWMMAATRAGLGGPVGRGAQWMPWIHIDDLVSIIIQAIEQESLRGPINGCGPSPARNGTFAEVLADLLNRPAWVRTPRWALSAAFGAPLAEAIASGQRVVPQKLMDQGFSFHHPELRGALRDILTKGR